MDFSLLVAWSGLVAAVCYVLNLCTVGKRGQVRGVKSDKSKKGSRSAAGAGPGPTMRKDLFGPVTGILTTGTMLESTSSPLNTKQFFFEIDDVVWQYWDVNLIHEVRLFTAANLSAVLVRLRRSAPGKFIVC